MDYVYTVERHYGYMRLDIVSLHKTREGAEKALQSVQGLYESEYCDYQSSWKIGTKFLED